jgi:hypothetical protein
MGNRKRKVRYSEGRIVCRRADSDRLTVRTYEFLSIIILGVISVGGLVELIRGTLVRPHWLMIPLLCAGIVWFLYVLGKRETLVIDLRQKRILYKKQNLFRSNITSCEGISNIGRVEKRWDCSGGDNDILTCRLSFDNGKTMEICPAPKAADMVASFLKDHGYNYEVVTTYENLGILSKTVTKKENMD